MALDATAREANVRDSLKKYFVDNLVTTEALNLFMFDVVLETPDLKDRSVDRWVSINLGSMDMSELSELYLYIFCCSRRDTEGFKLAKLRDIVMSYLVDTTKTDTMARIPLFQSHPTNAWVQQDSGFVVQEITESQQFMAEDGTKHKQIIARLRWSSVI